jgi:hypothetical protein
VDGSCVGVEQTEQDDNDTNAMVLPSKKRKSKSKDSEGQYVKKLSKTEKRKLESIVKRKAKKAKV